MSYLPVGREARVDLLPREEDKRVLAGLRQDWLEGGQREKGKAGGSSKRESLLTSLGIVIA
jgi:hypothetical protein